MNKILFMTLMAMSSLTVSAQETYENAKLASEDLNGTARYVGMGGAMEALGADISTMGSNPAGIGLFRRSTVSTSFGLVSQDDAKSFRNANKTNMSFDQIGLVYSTRFGRNSIVNVGFNYHKSKNFDFILSAAGRLNNASQSKLSYLKGQEGIFEIGQNGDGALVGYNGNDYSLAYNQLDYLYYNALLQDADGVFRYNNANGYMFNRGNSGYIGEYDFNISGNVNDRFYWGFTFGVHDVHYKGESMYRETLVDENGSSVGDVTINDTRKITGTGFDVKAGIIFRPIEYSPFRIGLYVHTPVWYDLNTNNYTTLTNGSTVGMYDDGSIGESYDFKFFTPWKFGVSLGHTFGDYLAIGATYEYADYGSSKMRVNDGGYYDAYWGDYYETSTNDEVMNRHIENTLKGVSTFKVGAEYKVAPGFSVRLGYNYVSPMFSKSGFKDGTLPSYGSYYSSATDYTNWKATNRITAGFGYATGKWNFDFAYAYSQTDGDFYPFMNYYPGSGEDASFANIVDGMKVSNKRNQLLLTVGYKF